MSLVSIGSTLVEVGLLLVFSLGVAHLLRKFDIPSVLGLILGGLAINAILLATSYSIANFFTDFRSLKAIITELALAWIGYEIGSHIDLQLAKRNGKRFGFILLSEAIGAFIIVFIGFYFFIFTNNLGLALILASISMATAPAATSQVLKEYGANGELTQIILFIVAFDDILSIFFANISFGVIEITNGSTSINLFSILFDVLIMLSTELLLSMVLGVLGTITILFCLRLKIINEQTLLEWLLGVSFILVATSLMLNISVILTMFVWGLLLKTFEDKKDYELLKQHIIKLEVLTVPIVLLFFILIGLLMEISTLIQITTLLIAISYFLFRAIGKATGTYSMCHLLHTKDKVTNNLPISLLTQAGIAIGLAGLAFEKLSALGLSDQASFVINIVGVSVILSEIFGPFLLKFALVRSGEGNHKLSTIKGLAIE